MPNCPLCSQWHAKSCECSKIGDSKSCPFGTSLESWNVRCIFQCFLFSGANKDWEYLPDVFCNKLEGGDIASKCGYSPNGLLCFQQLLARGPFLSVLRFRHDRNQLLGQSPEKSECWVCYPVLSLLWEKLELSFLLIMWCCAWERNYGENVP